MLQMRERPSPVGRRRAVPMGLLLATTLSAQAAVDFRAPDGSRFLLMPDQGPPIVHWAVATPIGPDIDPPNAPLLAAAAGRASLQGTWLLGSLDAAKEPSALDAFDATTTELQYAPVSFPGIDELKRRHEQLRQAAAALSDPSAFRRTLAAAPSRGLQLREHGDVAVLSLVTIPGGIGNVAALLHQRREHQALRDVRAELAALQDERARQWDAEPLARLYAEALAMAYPGHPLARAGDRPTAPACSRSLAFAAWNESQHPTNTVHVLCGGFDAAAARKALERAFATTALPAPRPRTPAAVRTLDAARRSTVPGARHPAALIAFPVPSTASRQAAAVVARWLGDGAESWLGRRLQQTGRLTATVAQKAPWPASAAQGLVVLEVTDAPGTDAELARDVLALLAQAAQAEPPAEELIRAAATLERERLTATASQTDRAAFLAVRALREPERLTAPALVPALPEVLDALRKTLGASPIVVEWRDA